MADSRSIEVTAPELSLSTWANLPLHRVVASCGLDRSGGLIGVGGVAAKALAAQAQASVRGLCFADGQDGLPDPKSLRPTLHMLKASSVEGLAQKIAESLDDVYGPVVALPAVLTAAPWSDGYASFNYQADAYCPFEWLDERVAAALDPSSDAQVWGLEPSALEHRDRGYVHVLGPASSGKTSWALSWVRQSLGEATPGRLPRLAGWYFARRFGQAGTPYGNHSSEVDALQTLVSLARRQHDLVPDEHLRLLLTDDERNYKPTLTAGGDDEKRLLEHFAAALEALADHAPATAEHPLVFLVDGGDEMWGPGASYQRAIFPRILPTLDQLPPHVYIVLVSRPGAHLQDPKDRTPLLRCSFSAEDVQRSIRAYLNNRAEVLAHSAPASEAADLLRDPALQDNICRASQDAFGYVTILLQRWLPSPVEQQLEALRRWRDAPETLPHGVYGLRAREFREMRRLCDIERDKLSIAELLALLTQLRWPLTREALIGLLYPGQQRTPEAHQEDDAKQLAQMLKRADPWLGESATGSGVLAFGHQSMAEVALAAWRLECQAGNPLAAIDAETRLAQEAQAIAQFGSGAGVRAADRDEAASVPANRLALSWLHTRLAGGMRDSEGQLPQRPWQGDQPARPAIGPDQDVDPSEAYAWVWGPVHALAAVAMAAEAKHSAKPAVLASARKVREQLINAPYLQSAIRAQAAHAKASHTPPDPLALREAYILADQLPGEDPDQTLRHRVEAALLQWHYRIAEETLQVGGMLWNLLGADDNGKHHAQQWKDSIDKPALITTLPGRPSDLMRQIPAKSSAVTPCGNWLVTSDGTSKTELWDLRDGPHRAAVHMTFSWALGRRFEAISTGKELGLGGIDGQDNKTLFLATIDLANRTGTRAQYAGHQSSINSVSFKSLAYPERQIFVLASGSDDHTVGLLLRTGREIAVDSNQVERQGATTSRIVRYAGHLRGVNSVCMKCHKQGDQLVFAVASGSTDKTVGLLIRTGEQLRSDLEILSPTVGLPHSGLIARYAGHTSAVRTVSLSNSEHDGSTLWAIASGSSDNTLGILLRTGQQIEDDMLQSRNGIEAPRLGHLVRYAGLRGESNGWDEKPGQLSHVQLANQCLSGQTVWSAAIGTSGGAVGFLLRTTKNILKEAGSSSHKLREPIARALTWFPAHVAEINTVRMQFKEFDGQAVWIVVSGAYDDTVCQLHFVEQLNSGIKPDLNPEANAPKVEIVAHHTYTGHHGSVGELSVLGQEHDKHKTWATVALGGRGAFGLMQLSFKGEFLHRESSAEEHQHAGPSQLARYTGHSEQLNAVSVHGAEFEGKAVWALGSGSHDGTVGLLIRTNDQIVGDLETSHFGIRGQNSDLLTRYAGHQGWITAVKVRSCDQSGQIIWGVASASTDNSVGLNIRSSRDIEMDRALRVEDAPISGQITLYPGHEDYIWGIDLQYLTKKGRTHWGVATSSVDCTVGLLLCPSHNLVGQTHTANTDSDQSIPRRVIRYSMLELPFSVRLHGRDRGKRAVWTIVTGSFQGPVSVLDRTSEHIAYDARRSARGKGDGKVRPRLQANYLGSLETVRTLSVQRHETSTHGIWAIASASDDNSVGLLVRTDEELVRDAQDPPDWKTGLIEMATTGLQTPILLSESASSIGVLDDSAQVKVCWLGGDTSVAMQWSCELTSSRPTMRIAYVCPLGNVPGFRAMDFAQSPDGIHYAVAGAVGNDVALMPLELINPNQGAAGRVVHKAS